MLNLTPLKEQSDKIDLKAVSLAGSISSQIVETFRRLAKRCNRLLNRYSDSDVHFNSDHINQFHKFDKEFKGQPCCAQLKNGRIIAGEYNGFKIRADQLFVSIGSKEVSLGRVSSLSIPVPEAVGAGGVVHKLVIVNGVISKMKLSKTDSGLDFAQ